jgi:hypothetical protein
MWYNRIRIDVLLADKTESRKVIGMIHVISHQLAVRFASGRIDIGQYSSAQENRSSTAFDFCTH